MLGLSTSYLTGAIVSLYNAGQAVGGLTSGRIADRFSRKYTISAMSILSTFRARAGRLYGRDPG